MPFTTKAQDKVEASVGADIVSGYIWRGQDLGGVSLQPSASIAYKGFSLEAWGSVGIEKTNADGYDAKELDLILGYSTGGFSISITDYWFNTGAGYFHYSAHNTAHLYEAQLCLFRAWFPEKLYRWSFWILLCRIRRDRKSVV